MGTPIPFEQLRAAVEEAGALVRCGARRIRVVKQGQTPDGVLHPTTDLDREVDDLLFRQMMRAFEDPGRVGYLTEERADDPSRLTRELVLIVDPIDGTRSVIQGRPEAAVSVALWARGDIVWGCVFNPFTQELFEARRGQGARCGGAPIHASGSSEVARANLVLSRTEAETGRLDWLSGRVRFQTVGSIAYKMCLVAGGRADGTFTPGRRHEWDIAAATLIVEEAGGRVTDGSGQPVRFNREDPEIRGLVVSNTSLHDDLLSLVRESPWGVAARDLA